MRRGLDVLAALGLAAVGVIWATQGEVTFGIFIAWLGAGVIALRWDWPATWRPWVPTAFFGVAGAVLVVDALIHHTSAGDVAIGLGCGIALALVPVALRLRRRRSS